MVESGPVVAASDGMQVAERLQAPPLLDPHPPGGEETVPSCAEVVAAHAAVETATLD